ncbi:MAG: hypothetical protein MZU97_14865 [Bacillus subtilis]|nr:hypothetical protein [Bacillus subtilis]
MDCLLVNLLPALKQPLDRDLAALQHLMKALKKITGKGQTKDGRDVFAQSPQPVPLPLSAERPAPPHALCDSMTQTGKDDPYRHVVTGPVAERTKSVEAAALGTDKPLQDKGRAVSVEVGIDVPVTPDPVAPTPLPQTRRRPGKRIVPATLKELLDTSREKQ